MVMDENEEEKRSNKLNEVKVIPQPSILPAKGRVVERSDDRVGRYTRDVNANAQ